MGDKVLSKLTAGRLIDSTNAGREDRAKQHIENIELIAIHQKGKKVDKSNFKKDKPITFKFSVQSISGSTYYPMVRFQEKISLYSPVKVSCTCRDFVFRSAYVLKSYDALYNPRNFKRITLTQPPNITNPDYTPQVCKHILALFDALRNEGLL